MCIHIFCKSMQLMLLIERNFHLKCRRSYPYMHKLFNVIFTVKNCFKNGPTTQPNWHVNLHVVISKHAKFWEIPLWNVGRATHKKFCDGGKDCMSLPEDGGYNKGCVKHCTKLLQDFLDKHSVFALTHLPKAQVG